MPTSRSRPASRLPRYFRETGPAVVDIAVYELSLRPTVPLVDLLYFEFLRSCLESGKIRQVIVFPWNGWHFEEQASEEESQLAVNLSRVFDARCWFAKCTRSSGCHCAARACCSDGYTFSPAQFLRQAASIFSFASASVSLNVW